MVHINTNVRLHFIPLIKHTLLRILPFNSKLFIAPASSLTTIYKILVGSMIYNYMIMFSIIINIFKFNTSLLTSTKDRIQRNAIHANIHREKSKTE